MRKNAKTKKKEFQLKKNHLTDRRVKTVKRINEFQCIKKSIRKAPKMMTKENQKKREPLPDRSVTTAKRKINETC